MSTLSVNLTLTSLSCPNCGVVFGITRGYRNDREGDRRTFYCPNGHTQWFPGETAEEKAVRLEKQLRQERNNLYGQVERARARELAEQRSHAATKGHLTRQRKRAAAALCPVEGCGRSIQQMRRHLSTKHPDYVEEHTRQHGAET